jgi:hypothetical protein
LVIDERAERFELTRLLVGCGELADARQRNRHYAAEITTMGAPDPATADAMASVSVLLGERHPDRRFLHWGRRSQSSCFLT